MKTIINKLVILLLAGFALASCTEQTEYDDTSFSAVEKLLYPSDGDAVDLIEQADANLYFEWEVSKVGTPVYTVVFMDAAKKELGRYLADNNGQKASLKCAHSQLNIIAGEAGILPNESGDIYWTVCAGLGGAEKLSPANPHKLTVKRYASIDSPMYLFITGDGSEFGASPVAAHRMRALGNGQFETYSRINGSFSFINRNEAGNKRTFGIADGRITEGADATASASNGVYHILVDFKRGTAVMEQVTDVALLRAGTRYDGTPLAAMQYQGAGVWVAENFTVPTSGDDRYRFRALVGGEYQIWGSKSGTDADDPGSIEEDPYFDVYVHTDAANLGDPNDYARIWKFYGQLKDLTLDVLLHMNAEKESYYHSFDLGFDPVATPVSTLTTPAADAVVELNAQAGSKETFSWVPLSGNSPEARLTNYSVVFYTDAAMENEVSRKSAGTNGTLDFAHGELQTIAEAAGIPKETSGDIYWAVESKLLSSTASSAARKLTITLMRGIPTTAYITGAASEFGNNFQALKEVGAGKFEIFTKLSVGSYNFTEGTGANDRKYVVNNGSISESTGTITSTEEAIYYILLDFTTSTAQYQKIENMRYITPNTKNQNTDKQIIMPYQGNGIWYAAAVVPYLRDWEDDRYFYWAEVDGVKTKFGADPGMRGDLNTAPAEDDARYRVFWPVYTVDGDDDGAFKMLHRYRGNDTKRVNIKLNMSPVTEHYYNYIEYLD